MYARCALLVSTRMLSLRHRASSVVQVSLLALERTIAHHVLAAGTLRPTVLCSVMRAVLVSTLLREQITAVCVLLVASMTIWTHPQRVWSVDLVGTLLLG